MAYTAWDFTVTQTVGDESVVTITAVVSGTDAAVTQRRVYLQTASGTFLVEDGVTTDYTQWSISDSSIDIDCLDKDYALRVYVEWLSVTNVVLYDAEQFVGCTLYNEGFMYSAVQLCAGNPLLINDNNFWGSLQLMRTYVDSGNHALSFAEDLLNAQLCYDKATNLRDNSQYYFNGNS